MRIRQPLSIVGRRSTNRLVANAKASERQRERICRQHPTCCWHGQPGVPLSYHVLVCARIVTPDVKLCFGIMNQWQVKPIGALPLPLGLKNDVGPVEVKLRQKGIKRYAGPSTHDKGQLVCTYNWD